MLRFVGIRLLFLFAVISSVQIFVVCSVVIKISKLFFLVYFVEVRMQFLNRVIWKCSMVAVLGKTRFVMLWVFGFCSVRSVHCGEMFW